MDTVAERGRIDRSGAVMDPIKICAWCLRGQPPTLTVLDGTPPELALLALEADDPADPQGPVSHGICPEHRDRVRGDLA